MAKKSGGKPKSAKSNKKPSGVRLAKAPARKPLLSGIVQLATAEEEVDEACAPEYDVDADKVHDIAFRFKALIEDAVALLGADDAAKFFLTATATAFGGDDLGGAVTHLFSETAEPLMEVYRLKVTLVDAPCKIERVLDVPDCSLGYLHEVLQDAFGWTNSHLHVFEDGDEHFGPSFEDDGMPGGDREDEDDVCLSDLIGSSRKKKFLYSYDFGDDWRHQIELVSRTPVEKRAAAAVCVEGQGASPPEDCGGVWGYSELLERLKAGKLEEEDFLDADFDPKDFDLAFVNRALKKLKWKDFH